MTDRKDIFYNAISKLENPNFEIVRQLPSGSHTAPKIIRMSDGRLAVLKQPVPLVQRQNETDADFEKRRGYMSQQWAKDIAVQDSVSKILSDYTGDLNVPRTIHYVSGPTGYIIEELATGTPLNSSLINNMSDTERKHLAELLANFLNYMHQKTAQQKKSTYGFFSSLDTPEKSATQQVIERFSSALPDKSDLLKQLFDEKITKDDYSVMVHSDIRAANIMYDQDNNKFSLIDFGNAKQGNKYHDMVLFASAANKELFPILLEASQIYNSLPKQKLPIFYNSDTIKKLFCRNVVFLAGFHAIRNKMSDKAIQDMWAKEIQPDLDYINTQYGKFIQKSWRSLDGEYHDK